MLWPDHRACPGLHRWLPAQLGDEAVVWTPADPWRVPGPLRRIAAAWPTWSPGEEDRPAVVFVSSLDAAIPGEVVASVRPGGRLVELAIVRRSARWWLRPWTWRTRAAHLAADRVAGWIRAGAVQVEQYASLDPPDVMLTMAVRG